MPYTSRHAGPSLTVEEQDVQQALAGYTAAGTTQFDWTPTAALWLAYRNWWAANRWRYDPDAPPRLTVRQFGWAVRRIFPGIDRCKRSYHGSRQWGFAYLAGPLSVITPPTRARKPDPATLATA